MRKLIVCLAACSILFCGCSPRHLIKNNEYRSKVEKAFESKKRLASNRSEILFSVFDNKLSTERKEALQFLFAFMPLSDLADYDGDFFLANADLALKTRNESQWGAEVPEEIFLHYVLPVRVNNENLDSFRIAYYNEINSRIKGLDATASALEINHWCHEKVTYQGADIRTSAPMSTILSARGRCGEESTFTVAALRTAGIPARQVYTPRWAHSDDNHAWVEVWIDGKWNYMGACEPDAVIDRGWFTEPARRAMLVHTRSFGAPSGNENTIAEYSDYSIVNNLAKYAITKNIFVKVIDPDSKPARDAYVEFQLYNYAEFFPIAVVQADINGISRFETGLGDLIIWARKGDNFAFKKISVNEVDTLTLQLAPLTDNILNQNYDLGVPVTRAPFEGPSAGIVKKNNKRVSEENRIRQAYVDSWMKPGEAVSIAQRTGTDSVQIKDIIARSMGNYKSVSSFLLNSPAEERTLAVKLLTLIADKDLRDTKEGILAEHLINSFRFENAANEYDQNLYDRYVLNPRIDNEIIAGWRKYLFASIPLNLRLQMIKDPSLIVKYVNERIAVNDSDNYYNTPLTPRGVDELRLADKQSRNIYFVALCRTLGIPSRLEEGSKIPQYFFEKQWNDVYFAGDRMQSGAKGWIKLTSDDKQPVPEYYTHFTIARFENGRYNTLEYDFNKRITDFSEEISLSPGNYMIVTGNRINDSKILSSVSFFELRENEHKTVSISLRKDSTPRQILGKFDLSPSVKCTDSSVKLLKEISDKGLVLVWVEPDKEPTKHIFNDLPLLKKELDNWGGAFIFLADPAVAGSNFKLEKYSGLPANSAFAFDTDQDLLKKVCGGVSCSTVRLPLLILVDKNSNIIFRSEGYRIGIGEQILKNLK